MTTTETTNEGVTGKAAAPVATEATKAAPATEATTAKPSVETKEATKPGSVLGELATEATKPVVPESYQFQFPEGVKPSDEIVGLFGELAKKSQMTQEQAQEAMGKMVEARQREAAAEIARLGTELRTSLESDPEIGGQKWPETQANIARALKLFADEKAVEVLSHPLVGNQRALAAMLARIGEKFREDRIQTGQSAPSGNPWGELYGTPSR